jgi:hypothetical protein
MKKHQLMALVCACCIVLCSSCEQKEIDKLATRPLHKIQKELKGQKGASCCQSNIPSRFGPQIPASINK